MKPKSSNTILPKMLNQDYSQLELSEAMAVDVHNMRFRTIDNNPDDLAWVNEKGTLDVTPKLVSLNGENKFKLIENINSVVIGEDDSNTDVVVGKENIGDYTVLFKHNPNGAEHPDSIHVLFLKDNTLCVYHIYNGNLNFSLEHLLDTVSVIEDANTYKVYWTDGINVPRFVDLNRVYNDYTGTEIDDQFDFKKFISDDITKYPCEIFVKKQSQGGAWYACLVGYAITAFDYQGSETPILQFSDLYFTNIECRALQPEEVTNCSFLISINISDYLKNKYQYLRIYRFVKQSPEQKEWNIYELDDIAINQDKNIYQITDNGTSGKSVLLKNFFATKTQTFKAQCIGLKDNTMFLGNLSIDFDYQLIRDILDEDGAYTLENDEKDVLQAIKEDFSNRFRVIQSNGQYSNKQNYLVLSNGKISEYNALVGLNND